jgi:enoyl-CoA hydratase/carnithine racemase
MSLVRYGSAGHVVTITMDRSPAHNAINNALCDELASPRFRGG